MVKDNLHIEIAFATATLQQVIAIVVSPETTIDQAIIQSGIIEIFPQYDLIKLPCGVHAKRIFDKQAYQIQDGDRIEIYRPLLITPNQQRQLRAK